MDSPFSGSVDFVLKGITTFVSRAGRYKLRTRTEKIYSEKINFQVEIAHYK